MRKIIKSGTILILSLLLGFGLHRTLTADLIMCFFPGLYMHIWVHLGGMLFQGLFIFIVFKQIIDKKINKVCTYMLWGCYFCILLFVLFIRMVGMRGINLNPFDIIKNMSLDPIFIFTTIMNVLIFIPLGYLFRKKTFVVALINAIIITFCIEMLQYILKVGIFDVDDIILNTLGFMIGYKINKIVTSIYIGRDTDTCKTSH